MTTRDVMRNFVLGGLNSSYIYTSHIYSTPQCEMLGRRFLERTADDDSDYANHPPPTDEEGEATAYYHYRSGSVNSETARPETNDPAVKSKTLNEEKKSLKRFGMRLLNARQHFFLALFRDLSLIPIVRDLFIVWKEWYAIRYNDSSEMIGFHVSRSSQVRTYELQTVTSVRSSEFFIAGIWCAVSAYLTYSILEGLMVRWIVCYSNNGAIMRMLSMSMFIVMLIQTFAVIFNPDGNYYLHCWILISCVLTGIYIVQHFVTSNIRLSSDTQAEAELKVNRKVRRTVDLYNITVFAVVPIGLASFVTMICLLRVLLILRFDVSDSGSIQNGLPGS